MCLLTFCEGCGFVKYAQRDMALAAINALNGIFTMRVRRVLVKRYLVDLLAAINYHLDASCLRAVINH